MGATARRQDWTSLRLRRPYTAIVQTAEGLQEGLVVWLAHDALHLLLLRPVAAPARIRARVDLGGLDAAADLELTVCEVGPRRLKGAGGSWSVHRTEWHPVTHDDEARVGAALAQDGPGPLGRRPGGDVLELQSVSRGASRGAHQRRESSLATHPAQRGGGRLAAMVSPTDALCVIVEARAPTSLHQAVRLRSSRCRLRLRLDDDVYLPRRLRVAIRLDEETYLQLDGEVKRREGTRLSVECSDVPREDIVLLEQARHRD